MKRQIDWHQDHGDSKVESLEILPKSHGWWKSSVAFFPDDDDMDSGGLAPRASGASRFLGQHMWPKEVADSDSKGGK